MGEYTIVLKSTERNATPCSKQHMHATRMWPVLADYAPKNYMACVTKRVASNMDAWARARKRKRPFLPAEVQDALVIDDPDDTGVDHHTEGMPCPAVLLLFLTCEMEGETLLILKMLVL